MKLIRLFLIGSLFFFALQASVMRVNAQQEYPEGITVIPSIKHIDLSSDPPEYDLKYVNNTGFDLRLELSVQDFSEIDEDYKIKYLEPKDAANYKYSLSSWLTFENKNLELLPGEEKSIKVYINEDRVPLGGHYSSILAKVVQGSVDQKINVNPIISSLLFVRASTGLEIESGEIISFEPDKSVLNFPENFILRFKNDGNVHVVPYGQVIITDMLGNRVASGILNERSLDALPESIRKYEIPIKKEAGFFIPGIYSAKIDMKYGENNRKLVKSKVFFSQGTINFFLILVIIISTSVVLFYLRKPIKEKLKKRKMEKPIDKKDQKKKK